MAKSLPLTQDYGYPLMYYGQRKVSLWPNRGEKTSSCAAALRVEDYFSKRAPRYVLFRITVHQFNDQLDLKHNTLAITTHLVRQGTGYLDLAIWKITLVFQLSARRTIRPIPGTKNHSFGVLTRSVESNNCVVDGASTDSSIENHSAVMPAQTLNVNRWRSGYQGNVDAWSWWVSEPDRPGGSHQPKASGAPMAYPRWLNSDDLYLPGAVQKQ